MNIILEILAATGFFLSVYAIYVERKSRGRDYHAVCDINDNVSCTKAFNSKYGKTFGVSNSIFGLLFYALMFALSALGLLQYVFYLSILSFLGTLYLMYALYFKLKDFCLVCTGIYLVNILLLAFSYFAI